MKKTLIALATSSLLAASASAFADGNSSGFYVGVADSAITYDSVIGDIDNNLLTVTGGYSFSNNLGMEVVAGTSLSDGSKTVSGVKVTAELASYYGAYLTAKLPVGDSFEINSKVGYASLTMDLKATDGTTTVKDSASDSSLSWGIGADYKINKSLKAGVEYMSYYNTSTEDVTGIGANLKYSF